MEELTNMNVRIVLNSNYGITVISGRLIRLFEGFVVIENRNGPYYIATHAIKTIQPQQMSGQNEER